MKRWAYIDTLQSSKAISTDPVVAALKAIVFAKKMGHNKVELKRYVLQVVQPLREDGKNWYRYGQLIADAHIVLQSLQKFKGSRS